MELFHIHRSNGTDPLYKENSEFTVGNDYNYFTKFAFMSAPNEIYYSVQEEFLDLQNLTKYENLLRMSTKDIVQLSNDLQTYIHNQMVNTREFVLEQARLNIDKNLPSRQRCIWLTDESSLDYWIHNIHGINLKVFRVEVDKEPFKSLDSLLPDPKSPIENMFITAEAYWKPDSELLKVDKSREYLYEGKIRIRERVK